jgi:hypothetical protein
MSNQQAIIEALAFLGALYPRFELTEPTIKAYTQILADVPPDLLHAAAKELGSRNTFFPAAAELRRAAFDLVERSQDMPSAYEAWRQIKARFGGRSADDVHPLAMKAIDSLGGLRAFGQSQIDDEPTWRARFIMAYDILAKREREQVTMLPEVKAYVDSLPAVQEMKQLTEKLSTNNKRPGLRAVEVTDDRPSRPDDGEAGARRGTDSVGGG